MVFAESPQDVVAAVKFAADQGRQIAAQATGHNAMPLGMLTGTILLKTGRMRGIQVDKRLRSRASRQERCGPMSCRLRSLTGLRL